MRTEESNSDRLKIELWIGRFERNYVIGNSWRLKEKRWDQWLKMIT